MKFNGFVSIVQMICAICIGALLIYYSRRSVKANGLGKALGHMGSLVHRPCRDGRVRIPRPAARQLVPRLLCSHDSLLRADGHSGIPDVSELLRQNRDRRFRIDAAVRAIRDGKSARMPRYAGAFHTMERKEMRRPKPSHFLLFKIISRSRKAGERSDALSL